MPKGAFFLTLLLAFCQSTHADNRDDLNRVIKQLEELNKQLQSYQSERSDLEGEMRDQELELSGLHRTMFETDEKIASGKSRLTAFNTERAELQTRLKQQEIGMRLDLVSMYKNGNEEPVKMLLNQEDPAVLSRTLTYYQYLLESRSKNISAYQATITELEENQSSIDKQNTDLANLSANLKTQETDLNASISRRANLLSRLADRIMSAEQEISEHREDAGRLEKLIRDAVEAIADLVPPDSYRPFAELKGKFSWPVTGNITHRFNSFRTGDLRWQGIVLKTNSGAVVKSIHHGRVVFADYMRGYGLLVIVDHEDGYMTLYGHNQSLFVEPGDWITPGDQLALVGSTGGLGETGLYFEVRQNGKPVNPTQWCSS